MADLLMQTCCITWLAWKRQSFIPLPNPTGLRPQQLKGNKMTEQEEKKLTEQVEDLAQLMRELAIERRQVLEQNSFLRAIGSLNDGVRNEFI